MTAPKTLPNEYEKAIKEAALSIKQLEDVRDLLPLAAYRAAQRDALRKLARAIVVQQSLLNQASDPTAPAFKLKVS